MRLQTCLAGLAAALLSTAPVRAQSTGSDWDSVPSAPIPPGAQPDRLELEAAILAYQRRLAAHPLACSGRSGCLKAPKAIKVKDHDCQARGADSKGGEILYCRVTYSHKGGSLAHVKSPNECVPLRSVRPESGTGLAWHYALVNREGKCPGARH